ncbi:MAG TPA: hypothetical protein VHV55_15250 [Pirellulales bacterium]|jgi:hypothetical protein|nr:hypothetical protein [Pirellulales bacterium]
MIGIFVNGRPMHAQSPNHLATWFARSAKRVRVAIVWCAAVLLCAGVSPALGAGEPALRNVNIHGLQIAGTTTLVIDGDNLGPQPKLLLPFAATQKLKAGSNDKRATIDVTLAAEVVPGYYNMWLMSAGGCSLPVIIAVDRLPQQIAPATAAKLPMTLPVALHGIVSGSATTEIHLAGKAGQALMVEVEAQRLGSKLRPIVHLYGPKHRQLAWSWGSSLLAGDSRLEATLPEAGDYTIAIHDAEYAAATPSFFRLKLGPWSAIDQVFPPVLPVGKSTTVEMLGPGVDLSIKAFESNAAPTPLPWPGEGTWTGPRPFAASSTLTELIEQKSKAPAQDLPAGPVAVSGRLLEPGEEDRYRLSVAPLAKLRLEIFAERYGSPLDTSIVIRDGKGAVLAQADDSPGTIDPVLEYTVPAKVDTIVVAVVDAQLRGGPQGIYRLAIEPATPEPPPDFALTTVAQRLSLSIGGRCVVPVLVERRGYSGPIEIAATGLPAGVRLEGTTIPARAEGTLVTIVRDKTNSGETHSIAAATSTWQGKATLAGTAVDLVRPVMLEGHPLARLQPWLATEMELAPSEAKAADLEIDWGPLPRDARLELTGKLVLPIKLKRADDKAPVRLSLITSQVVPLLRDRPDPAKTLRVEKAVELVANQNTGELTLLVPGELPGPVYDVTVQADLLAADKRTVLATAVAPVKRLDVLNPVTVELAGPTRIPVSLAQTGAVVKLAGKIQRRWGKTGDVTVSLAGLPTGARAAAVVVKSGNDDFITTLVLAAGTPEGEYKGLKLSATAVPDPKLRKVRIRSADTDLVLLVEPMAKKAEGSKP